MFSRKLRSIAKYGPGFLALLVAQGYSQVEAASLFIDTSLPPYNVKCDGVTNDTGGIMNAISDAPDGSVVTLPATGKPCETTWDIVLPNSKRVNLLGSGAIIEYSGTDSAIFVQDMLSTQTTNVIGQNPAPWIKGIGIHCVNAANAYGIHIRNSTNIVVEDVQITGCQVGIYIHNTTGTVYNGGNPQTKALWTEQNTFRNIDIYNCNFGVYMDPDNGASSFASNSFENFHIDTMANVGTASTVLDHNSGYTAYGFYIANGSAPYRVHFSNVTIFPDNWKSVGFYSNGDMQGDYGEINFESPCPSSGCANGAQSVIGILLDTRFTAGNGLNLYSHFAGFGHGNAQQVVANGVSQPAGWSIVSGY